jgi:hypothetical protein
VHRRELHQRCRDVADAGGVMPLLGEAC